ncbi:hypothetical protein ACP70R_001125 [Stipagrostis hirtigluma subsp. patula]
MAKKKGVLILLESDDEGPVFPSPPAKVAAPVIQIDDVADPKGQSSSGSRKVKAKDVANPTAVKSKPAASDRKSKEAKRTNPSSSGILAQPKKQGSCSARRPADAADVAIPYSIAPNVVMSVRLHEALRKLFDISISKSPFYVVKFAENQIRTGLPTEEPEPVEAEPKGDVDPDNAESVALASEQDQGAAIPCVFGYFYEADVDDEA